MLQVHTTAWMTLVNVMSKKTRHNDRVMDIPLYHSKDQGKLIYGNKTQKRGYSSGGDASVPPGKGVSLLGCRKSSVFLWEWITQPYM